MSEIKVNGYKDIISDAKREAREIIEQLNKLKFANVDKESKNIFQ